MISRLTAAGCRTAPLLALFIVLCATAPHTATAESDGRNPTQVVQTFHEILIVSLKQSDTLDYEGRTELIRPVFVETLDMNFMAEKSAGRDWKTFNDEQKQQWIEAFSEHTLANYASRFKGFSGQNFETHGEEEALSNTIVVKTTLIDPGGDDVQLNYRLRETLAGWRVIDIYVHGTVSELALRRAEYSAAIGRDGIDTTITQLQKQTQDLSVKADN